MVVALFTLFRINDYMRVEGPDSAVLRLIEGFES